MTPRVEQPPSPIEDQVACFDACFQAGVLPKEMKKVWLKVKKHIEDIERENFILSRPEAKLTDFGGENNDNRSEGEKSGDEGDQTVHSGWPTEPDLSHQ